jgi:ABC-2 type transport system ATP-binding protein
MLVMVQYSNMADVVLQTTNLSKEFTKRKGFSSPRRFYDKTSFTAVNDVNLTVERGEIFGLLGPNGAGKTTLTKMLCTLMLPSSGSGRINGFDIVRQQNRVKSSIALISSEERSFYWRLTGRNNLKFFSALYGLPRQYAEKRIDEVMDVVGITAAADRRFQEYSTGMKQRMALARGLLADPEIFFMDEPTKGLDPVATKHLHDFIRNELVPQGKTVILATHHLAEAEEVCDRVGIMSNGVMKACGNISDLAGDLTLIDYFHSLIEESRVEH